MRLMRGCAAIVVAIAALSAQAGVASASADAGASESVRYVHLGDSYAAGAGVQPEDPSSVAFDCGRSSNNYAQIVARRRGFHLTDVSCGGADTDDLFSAQKKGMRPQLDALDADVDLVTISIGGNDGVFGTAMVRCLAEGISTGLRGAPCAHRQGRSLMNRIQTFTRPRLSRALAEVRARAPEASVIVVGYPWITPSRAVVCPTIPVASGDIRFLHRRPASLKDTIAAVAAEVGARFVDLSAESDGRDACRPARVRWVEPFITDFAAPVHPNARGQRAMAAAVLDEVAAAGF